MTARVDDETHPRPWIPGQEEKSMLTSEYCSRVGVVLTLCVALLSGPALAQGQTKVAGGLEIHVGVVPAERAKALAGHDMPGAPRSTKNSYHVVVALFDATSHRRIGDAEVKATVAEPGLSGPTRKLVPMVVDDQPSYGSYFTLARPGIYQIRLQIKTPRAAKAIEAVFEHRHAGS